jgi:chromosome partitioning protein
MCKIISITSHKGGVAKTTSSVNLAAALAKLSLRILLVDLDPQANLSQSFNMENETETISEVFSHKLDRLPIKGVSKNLDLVPASLDLSAVEAGLYSNINSYFLLKGHLEKVKSSYDYIIIDTPPSLGIFTQNALIASTGVIIPVLPDFLSLKGLDTIKNLIGDVREKLNEKISILGLLITKTNNTKISRDISQSLRDSFNDLVFDTTIRQNVALTEASANRMDIFSYSPESPGAIDYMNLAKEIIL